MELELARSLVGKDAEPSVVESLVAGAEGNPLVLEERFFAMLQSGALVREDGAWRLGQALGEEVPAVLERIVRSRVDRLSPGAQEALRTASVFGPEVPLSYLTAASEALGDLQKAMDELSSRGLMQKVASRPEPRFRFCHALIQEAAYQGLLRGERRRRHARAATTIESAWAGRLEEVAGVLARHFAAAGSTPGRSSTSRSPAIMPRPPMPTRRPYLRSRRLWSLWPRSAGRTWRRRSRPPCEANWPTFTGSQPDGPRPRRSSRRPSGCWGGATPPNVPISGSAGDGWRWPIMPRRRRGSLRRGRGAAGPEPWEHGEAMADNWLELMLEGRALLYMRRWQPDRALAVLEAAQPVLEAHGRPARQAYYYEYRAGLRIRQNRHRIDEEAIGLLRRAVALAVRAGDRRQVRHWLEDGALGWSLVLFGRFDEGQELLQGTLARAQRIGDAYLRGQCLMALTVAALREHDVDALRSLAPWALVDCEANAYGSQAAVCKASLAWLAWQDGRRATSSPSPPRPQLSIGLATFSYLKWLGLFPLIAVHLAARVSEATAAAREISTPLSCGSRTACHQRWRLLARPGTTTNRTADSKLGEALELAHRFNYF